MEQKLEKIIELSISQGKEWDEIERLVLNKGVAIGISEENCKSILERNKPKPPKREEEVLENTEEDSGQENGIGNWLIRMGRTINSKDLTKEWEKLNSHFNKK